MTTTLTVTTIVVPRVMPMFVHDVRTSPADRRVRHLDVFTANLPQVFRSRYEAPDVVELIELLLNLTRNDAIPASTPALDSQQMRLAAIRCLSALFADAAAYTPATYKALRTIATRIATERSTVREARMKEYEEAMAILPPPEAPHREASDSVPTAESPGATEAPPQSTPRVKLPDDPTEKFDHVCAVDDALADLTTRGVIMALFQKWDAALIDPAAFVASPFTIHVYVPHRMSTNTRVYRDFAICTRRPKLTRPWGSASYVHVKTNIKAQSDIMYRFVFEGYNYGVNAAIFSDVVGCTNRRWTEIGNMTQYGWPEGWDAAMINDYASGCQASQYYSSDRFLTLRLKAKSMFSVGFSVSAWLVFHGYGEGFEVAVSFHHQDDDL